MGSLQATAKNVVIAKKSVKTIAENRPIYYARREHRQSERYLQK